MKKTSNSTTITDKNSTGENTDLSVDLRNIQQLKKNKIWNFQNPKTNETYGNYFIFSYLNDNYGYILNDQKTNTLIGIDFGDFERSKLATDLVAKITNSKLKFILTTHAHWDHSGGNAEWKDYLKDEIKIYSGDTPECKVPFSEMFLKDKEEICFGGNLSIQCLHTPGHIKSHVCYVLSDSQLSGQQQFAFTGDTLFSAGCGRVFTGTFDEMFWSLNMLKKSLNEETMIFCGHEYTLKNLQFALSIEPHSEVIKSKIQQVNEALNADEPTIGSFIRDEIKYNPFLRCDENYFKEKFNSQDPVEVFKIIRKLKDKF